MASNQIEAYNQSQPKTGLERLSKKFMTKPYRRVWFFLIEENIGKNYHFLNFHIEITIDF